MNSRILMLLMALLPLQRMGAQAHPTASPVHATDTTGQGALATITTDTGAFAPGHHGFARYNTIRLCIAAGLVTKTDLQRSLIYHAHIDHRLVTESAEGTLVGRETAAIARACGAHFTVAGTATRDLGDLFELAVLEQNDSLSQAALARRIAQASTADDRNAYWIAAIRSYLGAEPARTVAADVVVAQIDAQGPSARGTRVKVADLYADFFQQNNDTSGFRREAERIVTLARKEDSFQGSYFYEVNGYKDLMSVAVFEHPDSVSAVARRAQRDLSHFTPTDQAKFSEEVQMAWATAPVDSVITTLAPKWYQLLKAIHRSDTLAPRVQADYWFPAPGGDGGDTVRPVRGKVNVICQTTESANVQRWMTQYGAARLAATIVARPALTTVPFGTYGETRMKNRLSSHERDSVQSWVTNIVNAVNTSVPVAVQIEPIDLTWLPLPDGRLWTTKIEPAAEYVDDCTFVDRDGMILSIPNDPQFTGSGTSLIYNSILSWILSGRGASVISQDHAPSPHASPSATRGIAP